MWLFIFKKNPPMLYRIIIIHKTVFIRHKFFRFQNKLCYKVSLTNISLQDWGFQVLLGGWCLTKTVITGYSEAVNHTKMQRWMGVSGIHGNHGDRVLGCSPSPLSKALVNQWHVTLPATCLTSTVVSRHPWSTHVHPDKHNWVTHDEHLG